MLKRVKVSEIQESDVIEYLRLDDIEEKEITPILEAAISYVKKRTGLSISAEDDCMDDHSDITMAVMVICQDLYDNRSLYVESNNLNATIETILSMYDRNLG